MREMSGLSAAFVSSVYVQSLTCYLTALLELLLLLKSCDYAPAYILLVHPAYLHTRVVLIKPLNKNCAVK